MMAEEEAFKLRQKMVDEQLIRRGIIDDQVLASMRTVPRHLFVPESLQAYAYEDTPLPIEEGQTISQPYIVALMTEMAYLKAGARVLEIGTGSGYAAAVLAQIAAEVYTVERLASLGQAAQKRFDQLGYHNIISKISDGTLGWPDKKPFDAIIVAAGAPVAPEALLEQLNAGGKLVIPVGDQFMQELRCYSKTEKGIKMDVKERVRFVPLIGDQGWSVEK